MRSVNEAYEGATLPAGPTVTAKLAGGRPVASAVSSVTVNCSVSNEEAWAKTSLGAVLVSDTALRTGAVASAHGASDHMYEHTTVSIYSELTTCAGACI